MWVALESLESQQLNISNSCEQNLLTAMLEILKYLLENKGDKTCP